MTVGAQMPFDRLIRAVDEWAGAQGRTDVFAQIGATSYLPRHIRWTAFLEAADFRERYASCKAVVAHAGTGSILTALELGKPILVMPRRAALRETRNDHQVATAERFRRLRSVAVAWDENELGAQLSGIESLGAADTVGRHASRVLIESLRTFIDGGEIKTSLP
ncbi:MAG TPA: glycosyltransferase [Burkholderiales bacterium]|nr:glycosyltransferase [Burkholderiales bacterium]